MKIGDVKILNLQKLELEKVPNSINFVKYINLKELNLMDNEIANIETILYL
jgi:hypothetical protein